MATKLKTDMTSVDTTARELLDLQRATHIYTYRYLCKFKDSSGKISVRMLSGLMPEHEEFAKAISVEEGILSCLREYVCEYDINFAGVTEVVKEDKQKDETL